MESSNESSSNANEQPSGSSTSQPTVGAQAESADSDKASASQEEGGAFECNICFEPAKDSVVTMCGHLFCWPCLSRWLDARGTTAVCPVCKSAISRDRCVPIYGRNADGQRDPRNTAGTSNASSSDTPRRPQGQREEPAQNPQFFGTPFDLAGMGNGFNLSFGIGAFPFALFSTFNLGGMPNQNGARRNEAMDGQPIENDWLLSRAFLLLAIFLFVWLVVL